MAYIGAFLVLNGLLILKIALPDLQLPNLVTIANQPELSGWLSRGGLITLAALAIVVVNALLPSGWKASIVFWRLRDALPGHRAFSKIAKEDPRIDLKALGERVGNWPTAAREQNSTWYKLFKKHESATEVAAEHGRFLLFRDLAALTLLLLVAVPVTIFWGAERPALVQLEIILVIEFLLLVIPARHSGNRLVANVLARECC